MTLALASILALTAPLALAPAPTDPPPPDILLVIADDLGTADLAAYAGLTDPPHPDVAVTPRIDALAATGTIYARAYANPVCSPSRFALLTGQYAARSGVGIAVKPPTPRDLPDGTPTLFHALGAKGYQTAAFGKWHLTGDGLPNGGPDPFGPMLHGADTWRAGSLVGVGGDYRDWPRIDDGVLSQSTAYNTTAIGNAAVNWINAAELAQATADPPGPPWFAYVAFNAPHAPFHVPPVGQQYSNVPPSQEPFLPARARFLLMLEALDRQLGRILDAAGPEALVVFLADNGTPADATRADLDPTHQKGSPFEGGVRVPLIVRLPATAPPSLPAASWATLGLVDVAAALDATGAILGAPGASWGLPTPGFAPDGAPVLATGRPWAYGERFNPDGGLDIRFAVGRRWKLIREGCSTFPPGAPGGVPLWTAYDLAADPLELAPLPGDAAPLELRAAVDRIAGFCWEPGGVNRGSRPADPRCTAGRPAPPSPTCRASRR